MRLSGTWGSGVVAVLPIHIIYAKIPVGLRPRQARRVRLLIFCLLIYWARNIVRIVYAPFVLFGTNWHDLSFTIRERGTTTMIAETLNGQFEVLRLLGEGGQARTYLARDLHSGEQVAVKELRLGRAADWKAIELFERESAILRNLDYPALPGYVDAFHLEEGARVCLVQEFIDGTDLASLVEAGELFDEEGIREFLGQMLKTLIYLQDFSPPVVHRDIKPSNILRDAGGNYHLVDFGAVQVIVQDDVGGSTVVGTSGFMPPEQLMGRATQASDIYSLAATCVQMACGMHPGDMPMERMKLQFREFCGLSDGLNDVLEKMLEPIVSGRIGNARDVQAALEDSLSAPGAPPKAPTIFHRSAGLMPPAGPQKDAPLATQREALEERLHQLIDRPPDFITYSDISLKNDALRIQIELPSAPRVLAIRRQKRRRAHLRRNRPDHPGSARRCGLSGRALP